jgi:hypothetical protein
MRKCVPKKGKQPPSSEDFELMAQTVETLMKKVAQLEEVQVPASQTNGNTLTTNSHNNSNNTNNIQQNITINAFGKEDISYITNHPSCKNWFLNKCIKPQILGLCEFLSKKHLNPNHPENQTLQKLVKKDKYMEYFDGKAWKLSFVDTVLDDALARMEKDFQECAKQLPSDPRTTRFLRNFMDNVGEPLSWDLDNENFTYKEDNSDSDDGDSSSSSDEDSEAEKEEVKRKIFEIMCEYVYRHSKDKKREKTMNTETTTQ